MIPRSHPRLPFVLAALSLLDACGKIGHAGPAAGAPAEESAYAMHAEARRGEEVPGRVVPFVKTPEPVVAAMLELGRIAPADVVFDLGCGDGRMVIAAVGRAGAARGVGVEIVPEIAAEAARQVRAAGLADRIAIRTADIFAVPLSEATVVMMYLLFTVNLRLRPQLIRDLAPGARVVSHTFQMGDAWPPDESRRVTTDTEHDLFAWVVPAAVGGQWRGTIDDGRATPLTLRLEQVFARVDGARLDGEPRALREGAVRGTRLGFAIGSDAFDAEWVAGDPPRLVGTVTSGGSRWTWSAAQAPVVVAGEYAWREGCEACGSSGEAAADLVLIIEGDGRGWRARLGRDGDFSPVHDFYLWGASVYFGLGNVEYGMPSAEYRGTIGADGIDGAVARGKVAVPWSARRRL